MKSTNRIHRNGASSTIATQSQKPVATEAAEIPTLTIAKSNGKNLVPLLTFPLPLQDWQSACLREKAMSQQGRSFFAEAIQAFTNHKLMTLADRLDHAVRKLEILDSFILNAECSLDHLDKKDREAIEFGKTLLTRGVVQELAACRDAIMSAAYSKAEVAA